MVVTNPKDQVLFVRRNDPTSESWSLPMGRIRPSEKVDAAAIREAREEAGVSITVRAVPTVYKVRIRFKDWDLVRWHFQVVASTETSDVSPIDTEEIHEAMFFSAPPKIPDPFLKRWTIEMLRSQGLA
jgi:8-oxo-dGTP pyrophosphatase MutT (NUDIX family)